jgi:hypothetical protein
MPDQSPERDKHESNSAACHGRNQPKSKARLHMKLSDDWMVCQNQIISRVVHQNRLPKSSGVDGRLPRRRFLTAIGLVPVAQVQLDASWSLRFD